jgi:hypothetical protein
MTRSVSLVLLSAALACLLLLISITSGLVVENQVEEIKVTKIVKVQKPKVLNSEQKVQVFVKQLMVKRQADCLLWIFQKESHINPKAKNPNSSAKGIGQLLDSTYKNIGLKHSADPIAQVVASIAYISRHYGSGSACAAKSFWQKNYYY